MSVERIRNAIAAARGHLSAHPEKGRSADRPATAVLEEGLRARVEGPEGAVALTDMPAGVGGEASAPTPGWVARAALASCDATVIAMRAAELGIRLDRLEVTVESESDSRGLLGIGEGSAGPVSVRACVRLSAPGVEEQQLREVVDWALRHSPVGEIFRRPLPPEVEVEVIQPATEAVS